MSISKSRGAGLKALLSTTVLSFGMAPTALAIQLNSGPTLTNNQALSTSSTCRMGFSLNLTGDTEDQFTTQPRDNYRLSLVRENGTVLNAGASNIGVGETVAFDRAHEVSFGASVPSHRLFFVFYDSPDNVTEIARTEITPAYLRQIPEFVPGRDACTRLANAIEGANPNTDPVADAGNDGSMQIPSGGPFIGPTLSGSQSCSHST